MRRNFVTFFRECLRRFWVLLKRLANCICRHGISMFLKAIQQAPDTNPRAIFIITLGNQRSYSNGRGLFGLLPQSVLGLIVAIQNGSL